MAAIGTGDVFSDGPLVAGRSHPQHQWAGPAPYQSRAWPGTDMSSPRYMSPRCVPEHKYLDRRDRTQGQHVLARLEVGMECLVSVRRVLESYESSVIQGWWPDSRRGHRCGRVRTAPVTTAASCDIQAT